MKTITQKNYGKFSDPTSLLSLYPSRFPLIFPSPYPLLYPPFYPLTIPFPLPPVHPGISYRELNSSDLSLCNLAHYPLDHGVFDTNLPIFCCCYNLFGLRFPNARLILHSNIHTCALHTKWNFASSKHD